MLLCISGIPAQPTNFNFEVDPNDSRTVAITWTESEQTGPVDEVEDYVVEQSIDGGQFQLVCINTCTPLVVRYDQWSSVIVRTVL